MERCRDVRTRIDEDYRKVTALKRTTKMALSVGLLVPLAIGFWLGSSVPSTAHGEGESVPNEIRARNFVVVDDTGKDRAKFGIIEDQVEMVLWNKNRSTSLSVSMDRSGMPRITFENSQAQPLLELVMIEDKYPAFVMSDAKGRRRLGMVITDTGVVVLSFYDTKKRGRCTITVDGDGIPQIALKDDKGNVRAIFVLDDKGTCGLGLLNSQSQGRIVFQVDAEGQAEAVVFGPDGKATWSAGKP